MYLNGSGVLLSKGDDVIVGQMDLTINYSGKTIDLTNYALGGWRELMPNVLTDYGLTIDASITFTDDETFQQVLNDSLTGTGAVYKVTYPNGYFFSCYMIPTNLSYNAAKNNALSVNLTFVSSSEEGRTGPATSALVTVLYPVQYFEQEMTGTVSISDIRDLIVNIETPIVSGTVGIEEIIIDSLVTEYTETENEITGAVSIESIDQAQVLIAYTETENEITGAVSIDSIDQAQVLIAYTETENEITGTVSITEITKA